MNTTNLRLSERFCGLPHLEHLCRLGLPTNIRWKGIPNAPHARFCFDFSILSEPEPLEFSECLKELFVCVPALNPTALVQIGHFVGDRSREEVCLDLENGSLWLINLEGVEDSLDAAFSMGHGLSERRKKTLAANEIVSFLNLSSDRFVDCVGALVSFLGLVDGPIDQGDLDSLETFIRRVDSEGYRANSFWREIVASMQGGEEF